MAEYTLYSLNWAKKKEVKRRSFFFFFFFLQQSSTKTPPPAWLPIGLEIALPMAHHSGQSEVTVAWVLANQEQVLGQVFAQLRCKNRRDALTRGGLRAAIWIGEGFEKVLATRFPKNLLRNNNNVDNSNTIFELTRYVFVSLARTV